jgi:hypothetical protein
LLLAGDEVRQGLRVITGHGGEIHRQTIGFRFVGPLELKEAHGHYAGALSSVSGPSTPEDQRNCRLLSKLTPRRLSGVVSRGNMRDAVSQRSGEFGFVPGGENQSGGDEDISSRQRGGFEECPGRIRGQLVVVSERGRLRQRLREVCADLSDGIASRGAIQSCMLAPEIRGKLRAQRLFLFDAIRIDALARVAIADLILRTQRQRGEQS